MSWKLHEGVTTFFFIPPPTLFVDATAALTDVGTWPGKTEASGCGLLDMSCDSAPSRMAQNTDGDSWYPFYNSSSWWTQCHMATVSIWSSEHIELLHLTLNDLRTNSFYHGLFVSTNLSSSLNSWHEEAIQQDELPHDCDDVRMNSSGAVADGVSGVGWASQWIWQKVWRQMKLLCFVLKACKIPVCVWCESGTNNSARAQFASTSWCTSSNFLHVWVWREQLSLHLDELAKVSI